MTRKIFEKTKQLKMEQEITKNMSLRRRGSRRSIRVVDDNEIESTNRKRCC